MKTHCLMQSLDMEHIRHIFSKSKEASEASTSAHITPLQPGDVKCIDDVSDGEEMRWIRTGFKLIAEVCVHQLSNKQWPARDEHSKETSEGHMKQLQLKLVKRRLCTGCTQGGRHQAQSLACRASWG